MKNLLLLFLSIITILLIFNGYIFFINKQNDVNTINYNFDEKYAQTLINKECIKDDSNVYLTECTIDLLDKVAAEREWKQRKIETMKHPQINIYNLSGDLNEWQLIIGNWRKNFEKMRNEWCEARTSFRIGSGVPLYTTTCQIEFELLAINDLNYLYYQTIMKDVSDSQGVPNFEPLKVDIDALTKVNATVRGCVWANEKEPNCDSPIDITPIN